MPTVMLIPIYLMIPTMHRALEVVRSLLLWKVWIPIDVGGVARYEEKCKRTPATGGADLAGSIIRTKPAPIELASVAEGPLCKYGK